jgi:hypothetical protein
MQSAQVNQMTMQLKDKIENIQSLYKLGNDTLTHILGPDYIKYDELISS